MTPDDVYELVSSHKRISYFLLVVASAVALLTTAQIIVTVVVWVRVIGLLKAGNELFQKSVALLNMTERHADVTDLAAQTAARRVEELEKRHESDASILIQTTSQVKDKVEAVKTTVDFIKDTVTASDTAKHA